MNFFVTVESSLTSLEVAKLGVERLEQILTGNLELRWNRDGHEKRVPRHVLQNALQYYRDNQKLISARRIPPPAIHWNQAEDLPDVNVRPNVIPNVGPAPRHDGRSPGGVGAPT